MNEVELKRNTSTERKEVVEKNVICGGDRVKVEEEVGSQSCCFC